MRLTLFISGWMLVWINRELLEIPSNFGVSSLECVWWRQGILGSIWIVLAHWFQRRSQRAAHTCIFQWIDSRIWSQATAAKIWVTSPAHHTCTTSSTSLLTLKVLRCILGWSVSSRQIFEVILNALLLATLILRCVLQMRVFFFAGRYATTHIFIIQ